MDPMKATAQLPIQKDFPETTIAGIMMLRPIRTANTKTNNLTPDRDAFICIPIYELFLFS